MIIRSYCMMLATILCLAGITAVPGPAKAQRDSPLNVSLVVSSDENIEGSYLYQLLDLALSSQERPYTLTAKAVRASQLRRIETVRSSGEQLVINLGYSQEIDSMLRSVPVPTFFGTDLRQRIMLTRKDLEPELKKVQNIEDLKQFVFGQGLGWSDVDILRNAGLRVLTASSKEILARMLHAGRFDLFPRGLFEVIPDRERISTDHPDIVIDQHLLLTYPIASFFFVNRSNRELHSAILTGLNNAYTSGRMQDLFMADPHHRQALERLHPCKRTVIAIPMPGHHEKVLDALKRYPLIPDSPKSAPASGS